MNWISSSHCDSNTCVQFAWIKSSYSTDNGTCVQWAWTKSSYSAGNGACVEVAQDTEIGLLRDSKDPDGPVLQFPRQAVREFLTGVKADQFPG